MSKQIAESWLKAFQEKRVSKLKLAEDFVHTSPFGEVVGRDVYLKLVEDNEAAFFSSKIEILDVIGAEGTYAVRYLVNGNPACDCIYIVDGLISKIYSYYHYGEKPSF